MELDQGLQNVSVIGAAGKMGKGIAALLFKEILRVELEKTGSVGKGEYRLNLIDSYEPALVALKKYLKEQALKYAEKNINFLRKCYSKDLQLVSNAEIIEVFVEGADEVVRFETTLEAAKKSSLIFEAVVEDIEVKVNIFKTITANSPHKPYIFSNTSSIPIAILNEKALLDHRIVGFHFYNPPEVQKLVEVICPEATEIPLKKLAEDLAKRLNKITVHSQDVAGFIGNGHFIREAVFACQKVNALTQEYSWEEALYIVNEITQKWLLRPMGIFQLIDYVGIDVAQKIMQIMSQFLQDPTLHQPLINEMLAEEVAGGQYPNGTQKNGFFKYGPQGPEAVYYLHQDSYRTFENGWIQKIQSSLGERPDQNVSWKQLHKDPNKNEKLKNYFQQLYQSDAKGAEWAREFLQHSKKVAENLVKDGVASNLEDVDRVLINGFYHLYGAGAPFLHPQKINQRS